ncbi:MULTISPECIES: type II secretion system minor pseudopilin GspI [unclassified Sphingomonas]|uniref:type II secretion system minor pseudopilin GspI n=1 Tax=unclassified Sphingomonas TaxID=196159 RepID=UPI001F59FD7B|nr:MULTISPECIES: type II secretion system minor pseudopilin GspI [unclassified Sphingomonas]
MRSERGFTLIEVMVALAVFSLAVLALVRLESATIRGAATLDGSLVGDMVARNVAIEALTDARAPTIGVVRGGEVNGGRQWNWTRTVTPLGDARIVTIDVVVTDPRGQVLGRASLVRPPDPATGA